MPVFAGVRDGLPTFRGYSEQATAHAAIAVAEATFPRRTMAVTTSIGLAALKQVG